MESKKITVKPFLYYMLLSSLTNLAFMVVGLVALTLLSFSIKGEVVTIIGIVLLWKGALVGFITWAYHRQSHNKEFAVKFIGLYLGRFFGIFIGGFLGASIANLVTPRFVFLGFIIGALSFYFVGRWIGAKISFTISGQLDKVVSIIEIEQPLVSIEKESLFKGFVLVIYIVILPLLFVIIAVLINYSGIHINSLIELLPGARIFALGLIVFSLFYHWFIRKRSLMRAQTQTTLSESTIYWLGLSFSIVPLVYGFFLFLVFGASITELCIYAFITSISGIVWNASNPQVNEGKAA